MRKTLSFPIPFYTQGVKADTWEKEGFMSFEEGKSWEMRGCGIASLRMIVDGYKQTEDKTFSCGGQGEMIYKGVGAGAYLDGVGWIHQGLANMAQEYGLIGTANREKTIFDVVEDLKKDKACILSVAPRYAGGKPDENGNIRGKSGHLVVAYGYEEDENGELIAILTHHSSCFDEYNRADWRVELADMLASFSGNYIAFEKTKEDVSCI